MRPISLPRSRLLSLSPLLARSRSPCVRLRVALLSETMAPLSLGFSWFSWHFCKLFVGSTGSCTLGGVFTLVGWVCYGGVYE